MHDNVIKFVPKSKLNGSNPQNVIVDELEIESSAADFANDIIHMIHDHLHDMDRDCIFSDDKYSNMISLTGEILMALFLKTQNVNHPLHEIADTFFDNEGSTEK